MRTLIDAVCPGCGDVHVDVWMETVRPQLPICGSCQVPLVRHWRRTAAGVKADSIPGGLWIEHGLCHPDGTPKRYDSHSEIAREAKRRGLVNIVQHATPKGTDKAPHTQRHV